MSNVLTFYDKVRTHVGLQVADFQINQIEAIGVLTLLANEISADVLVENKILAAGESHEGDESND